MSETQYRILGPDEVIQEGDEFRLPLGHNEWSGVDEEIGKTPDHPSFTNFFTEKNCYEFRRPTPAYTVTELHTPSGSLDAVTKRCERAEKALGVAVAALEKIKEDYEMHHELTGHNATEALAQIEALNTDTEK